MSKPVPTNVNDTAPAPDVMRYELPAVHGSDAPQTESAGDVVNMVSERNTMVTDPVPDVGVPSVTVDVVPPMAKPTVTEIVLPSSAAANVVALLEQPAEAVHPGVTRGVEIVPPADSVRVNWL